MSKDALDRLRSKKKPVSKSVWLCGDSDIAQEYQAMQGDLALAEMELAADSGSQEKTARVRQLQIQIAEYERDKVKDVSIHFRFQSIGRKRYEQLIKDNQPTPDEIREAEEAKSNDPDLAGATLTFSPKTFPPAFLAACLVEPDDITKEEALEWFSDGDWNENEIATLLQTCMEVNMQVQVVQMGKDFGKTPAS